MPYTVGHYFNKTVDKLFTDPNARFWLSSGGGSSFVTSLTTTGTSGAATVVAGVLNIPDYTSNFTSLTVSGQSGPATLSTGTLNIPTYVDANTSWTLAGGLLRIHHVNNSAGGLSFTGTAAAANALYMSINTANIVTVNGFGTGSGDAMYIGMQANAQGTSGTTNCVAIIGTFNPTSGTGVYNHFNISPTINQTGGANGITRGLYIAGGGLTAVADYRAIEVAAGKVVLAPATTSYASLVFQTGTAPTSPANGNIWHDGTNLNLYSGLLIRSTSNGNTFAGGLILGNVGGGTRYTIQHNESTGEIRHTTPASYFPTFYSSGAEVLRLSTGGNMLVGTTSDDGTSKLQVSSSTTTIAKVISTGSNQSTAFRQTPTGTGNAFWDNSTVGSSSIFRVSSASTLDQTALTLAPSAVTIGLAFKIGITEGTDGRVGQTTLVSGTKAITINGLTTNSRAFVQLVAQSGTSTTVYEYIAVCTSNTLTITAITTTGSTVTTDTSTLNYFVIN